MKKINCLGCQNDFYNRNDMGMNLVNVKPQCWAFPEAKIVSKKEVSINQRPPWNQDAIRVPNCYRRSGYIYMDANRTC